MVDKKILDLALQLVAENKNRLLKDSETDFCIPKISPQNEVEALFIFILRRFGWAIKGVFPAQRSIVVNLDLISTGVGFILQQDRVSEYNPKFTKEKNELIRAMEEVSNIFNQLSDNSSFCFLSAVKFSKYEDVKLTVLMKTY